MRWQGLTYFCFFDPLWVFSVFSADLSLEWLESRESTDSLDLPRLRSLSLCFLRRSISRRRSTGSSLYFPSACQKKMKMKVFGVQGCQLNHPINCGYYSSGVVQRENWECEAPHPSLGGMQMSQEATSWGSLPQIPNPFSKVIMVPSKHALYWSCFVSSAVP